MGAWIEITVEVWTEGESNVAPLVGAWIEIVLSNDGFSLSLVAPLVGAWIEILKKTRIPQTVPSLPLWERGLKFNSILSELRSQESLPLWERGLKLNE